MKTLALILSLSLYSALSFSNEVKPGDPAKTFKLKTHTGEDFDLQSRKGKWTVLYFFPKAETPGCTKQACSFRDNIKKIRAQDAEVFGISTDNVKNQAAFVKNHALNFILLADDKAQVTTAYGAKIPLMTMSKRWTFIIDPNLIIRDIARDVDPVTDAARVAKTISELK